jgi:hypothetical protein
MAVPKQGKRLPKSVRLVLLHDFLVPLQLACFYAINYFADGSHDDPLCSSPLNGLLLNRAN